MQADVTSIPAIREWHAALSVYNEELTEILNAVQMEIRRGIDWVDHQHTLWTRAVRQCQDEVLKAKNELAQRKIIIAGEREPDVTDQIRNLRRATARLELAEEKVTTCKKTLIRLPKMVDEVFQGPARRLQAIVEGEMTRSIARIAAQIESLERYSDLKTDYAAAPSASSTGAVIPTAPKPKGES